MSYTMRDWLSDTLHPAAAGGLADRMVEDKRAIVRIPDMDALVAFAAEVFDVDDEKTWELEGANTDVMLAIVHWRKERRDWTG